MNERHAGRQAELSRTRETRQAIAECGHLDRTNELTWAGTEPFQMDGMRHDDAIIAQYTIHRVLPGVRYAADSGAWLLRRQTAWENVGPNYAPTLLASIRELAPRGDTKADKGTEGARDAAVYGRLSSAGGIGAIARYMEALASSPRSPAYERVSELDNDPETLWAGGQAWNLRRNEPDERIDPGTPHLHTAAVTPERVHTPYWAELTHLVWPDAEVRDWALNVLAVSLTGYPAAVLPILCGKEGRGKSSVVSLLIRALGTYGDSVSPKLLSGAEGHASIVYALQGLRLAFIDEGPRGGQVALETLKQLTGGTKLTGNRMRENPVTFNPTHTLVLTCNEPPPLADPAIRRRVKLIPCESGYAEAITEVMQVLGPDGEGSVWRDEAPGVLADMMRRASAWLRDRSIVDNAPSGVVELVQDIAAEQDPVVQWVAEQTEDNPLGTKAGDLYAAFVDWCRARNIKSPPNMTAWGRRLNDMGHDRDKRGGVAYRPLKVRAHTYVLPGAALHLAS